MKRLLFKEEQRFTQWWLWSILLASFTIPSLFMIKEISIAEPGSEAYRDLLTDILVLLGMCVLLLVFFAKMKLSTEISTTGIRVKFPPLKMRWKVIAKDEIDRFEVGEYHPIKDFGGWGIRKNIFRKKDAYNVKGNIGLQLFLKNGKTLLIGTQRKQAIKYAMDKLFSDGEADVKDKTTGAFKEKPGFVRKAKKLLVLFGLELAVILIIFTIIQLFNL